jgi:hypothetical protein
MHSQHLMKSLPLKGQGGDGERSGGGRQQCDVRPCTDAWARASVPDTFSPLIVFRLLIAVRWQTELRVKQTREVDIAQASFVGTTEPLG